MSAILSAAVSERIAAAASAGDRIAAAGSGPVVEKPIVETVVISIARAAVEFGRAGSASVISAGRVRFRAETPASTKKPMQFHPLQSGAVNARRAGGFGHGRENILSGDAMSGFAAAPRLTGRGCGAAPPPPSTCRGLLEHVPFMVNGTCSTAGRTHAMTTLTVGAPTSPSRIWAFVRGDARHFQIAALACLLAFNIAFLDFGARPLNSALAIVCALATQALCSRIWRLPVIDLRSPLITGLSLSLLLRADE